MKKLFFLTLIVSLSVNTALSQRRQSASVASEPENFQIGSGCSFTASPGQSSSAPASLSASADAKRIMSDISEAISIIRKNHADGGQLDYNQLTKSLVDSALRTLDPHSNYFDSSEYRDLMEEEQSEYSGIGVAINNYERRSRIDT